MSKNFIDEWLEIGKIDPNDIFKGFYKRFALIEQMEIKELVIAKQTLDLALKFVDNLDSEQETTLLHIVSAMQQKAAFGCHPSHEQSVLLRKLFLFDMYYHLAELAFDHNKKTIIPKIRTQEATAKQPQKKILVQFSRVLRRFNRPIGRISRITTFIRKPLARESSWAAFSFPDIVMLNLFQHLVEYQPNPPTSD